MTTKTVLITGAAGQLGQAVAARFRQDGLRLILADRNEQHSNKCLASATMKYCCL
jgi:NAD(P)-dependent dehydrogenase (short-subunit alcohol dehydrogenase family)